MKSYKICGLLLCTYLILTKVANLKTDTYCVSENPLSCNASVSFSCVECHPLMWFVNGTQDIPCDTTIIFLPGEHSLNSKEQDRAIVNFFNKKNLTLKGIETEKEASTVVCSGEKSGFLFQNSSNVAIINIQFRYCGASMSNHLHGGVVLTHSYNINISQVSIYGCKGYGLQISDCYGNITIEKSFFTGNKDGNVVIWLNQELSSTFLKINSSSFQDGFTQTRNATGLHLIILQSRVDVDLTNLLFRNNTGINGGNIAIHFQDFAQNTSTVNIRHCRIEGGHVINGSGGGMNIWFEKNLEEDNTCYTKIFLTVFKTIFKGNSAEWGGGGVKVTYHERPGKGCTNGELKFESCVFTENISPQGSALEVTKHKVPIFWVHSVPQFSVYLNECLIENNTVNPTGDRSNEEGVVEIKSLEELVIVNSRFINNNGTALMLVGSGVQFYDETVFENNSAKYGAAIKLCDSSVMYFDNYTRVKFLNNRAHSAGGAIYAGKQCLQEIPPCFFQMTYNLSNTPIIEEIAKGILYFEGNQAEIAGKAIYGGSVDKCLTNTELRFNSRSEKSYYYSLDLFYQIFNFSNPNKTSLVTSDPYGVCICNKTTNIPNCTQRNLNLTKFAGEYFTVYVSAVGQMNGTVPSKILIDFTKSECKVHQVNSENDTYVLCHTLELVVLPNKSATRVTFKLGVVQTNVVSESSNYYHIPKLTVNVKVLPCPFLFNLNQSNSCDCPQYLKDKGFKCNIKDQTVTRPDKSFWIGCSLNTSHTDKCDLISYSEHCPDGRCSGNITSNMSSLIKGAICVEGREGRVCGRCKANYSFSLGFSKCISNEKCSTWSVLLIILAYLLSGIFLVVFFSFFNLTVSEGTINGLLFYTSCAQDSFNYLHTPAHSLYFTSWLNLESGFQVCFYRGMTAYQKVWLEFSFLLYLFSLGIMIVCLSRKFIWFTRLTGRNMVPVLSTIILIAYPKLVRNCIKVWQCQKNGYWSSDTSNPNPWIWHSDGTIDCFAGKHLILFIVSILLFAVAFLYTLCLLFIQCLQRGSGWCVLRWVNKLRPFFEANTGPCRDHYQFWPGFLLFARLGLYIVFWPVTDPKLRPYVVIGLCTLIFCLACVSPHGVYKKWPLNLLEFSFVIILCITAAAVVKHHNSGYISEVITVFIFLLILIYHIYKKLRETRRWKRMVIKFKRERRIKRGTGKRLTNPARLSENSSLLPPGQRMPLVINFSAAREPLLEDD